MMKPIGIRREDKSSWERRVPIIPADVAKLSKEHGIRFVVQPSPQRVFTEDEFLAAGAEVSEDLSGCPIIMGVKEIPEAIFEEEKTYVFFSHTIKGQSYNMDMLKKMMELKCDLIDYETITDEDGRRLVFFGDFAGLAGMIDALWAFGQRLKIEGRETPLLNIKPAHAYSSLAEAKEAIVEAGRELRESGSLRDLGPLVCGFTGYGRVSQGAQEIFDLLVPKIIQPEDLLTGEVPAADGEWVKVVFREEHMFSPRDAGAAFELQTYFEHPDRFQAEFPKYLPHLTLLMNCIFWTADCPRLATNDQIVALYSGDAPPRLRVIGDISCDPEGSIECLVKTTDPGNPVFVYDVERREDVDGFVGKGPVMLAVEILPTELPRESSASFSEALVGLIPQLSAADPSKSVSEWGLPAPLARAAILHRGRLTEGYGYLSEYVDG